MKKTLKKVLYALSAIFIVCGMLMIMPGNIFADTSVTFKVTDSVSSLALEGAQVSVTNAGTNYSDTTDAAGNVTFNLSNDNANSSYSVSKTGYETKTDSFKPNSISSPLEISLVPESSSSNTVVPLHAPHVEADSSTFEENSDDNGLTDPVVWHFVLNQIDKGTPVGTLTAVITINGVPQTYTVTGLFHGSDNGAMHFYLGTPGDGILTSAYATIAMQSDPTKPNLVLSHVTHNNGSQTGSITVNKSGLLGSDVAIFTLTGPTGQVNPVVTVDNNDADATYPSSYTWGDLPFGSYTLTETYPATGNTYTYTNNLGTDPIVVDGDETVDVVNTEDTTTTTGGGTTTTTVGDTTTTATTVLTVLGIQEDPGMIEVLGIQELPFTGQNTGLFVMGSLLILAGASIMAFLIMKKRKSIADKS